MVCLLAACSTIKSCRIFCAISITPILFNVLSVSIWKSHSLNLSTVDLYIASRQCVKMPSALSSPKVDSRLSVREKTDSGTS